MTDADDRTELERARSTQDFSVTHAVVDAARAGDEAAYQRLWDMFARGLRVDLVQRIQRLPDAMRVKMRSETEDILQAVMFNGLRGLAGFECRGPGATLAWLQRILENEFVNRINHWRAKRRNPDRESGPCAEDAPALAGQLRAGGKGPGTIAGQAEEIELVGRALAVLSERHCKMLSLRFFADATYSEIAELMEFAGEDAARYEIEAKALRAFAKAYKRLEGRGSPEA